MRVVRGGLECGDPRRVQFLFSTYPGLRLEIRLLRVLLSHFEALDSEESHIDELLPHCMLLPLCSGETIMARSVIGAALAASAAVWLSGCGTMANMRDADDPACKDWDDIVPRRSVYGGVRIHALQVWVMSVGPIVDGELSPVLGVAAGVAQLPLTFLSLADLPLTALGDTLTLPWTIAASLQPAPNLKTPPLKKATPNSELRREESALPPGSPPATPTAPSGESPAAPRP